MLSQHSDISVRMKELNKLLQEKFNISSEKSHTNTSNPRLIDIYLLNTCHTAESKKISDENKKPIEFFEKFDAKITWGVNKYSSLSSDLIVSVEKTSLIALCKALSKMPNATKERRANPSCGISPEFPF